MTELRKAAEEVLEAWNWDWSESRNKALKERMKALRQALAQPEWVGLTDEDFYGQSELQVITMKYAEAKLKKKNGK